MGRIFQRVSPEPTEPIDGGMNIFVHFDNPELKCAIENWAVSHGCTVTPGDGADIIGYIYFIGVVDRVKYGMKGWKGYLEFMGIVREEEENPDPSVKTREGLFMRFKQGGDAFSGITPMIIVDSDPEIIGPSGAPFFHCDPDDHSGIIAIIERFSDRGEQSK